MTTQEQRNTHIREASIMCLLLACVMALWGVVGMCERESYDENTLQYLMWDFRVFNAVHSMLVFAILRYLIYLHVKEIKD